MTYPHLLCGVTETSTNSKVRQKRSQDSYQHKHRRLRKLHSASFGFSDVIGATPAKIELTDPKSDELIRIDVHHHYKYMSMKGQTIRQAYAKTQARDL